MSKSKRAVAARENSQFLNRLAIERCRGYIHHAQAILHVCENVNEDVAEALQHLMQSLDLELRLNLQR